MKPMAQRVSWPARLAATLGAVATLACGDDSSSADEGAADASNASDAPVVSTAGSGGSNTMQPDASAGAPSAGGSGGTMAADARTRADATESDATSQRSAGCGLDNPPSGSLSLSVQGQDAQYVVSIPASYDPLVAYPLGFAFHGRNRTGPQCQAGDCAGFQSVMEDQAVLVYMTSLGGTGWEGDTERDLNVAFFEAVLALLKETYCIDVGRIFVAGTSSGAHFTNILACRYGDELSAAAPVAGFMPETTGCVGNVAALVIHGVDDYHVTFASGEEARDFYLMQNGCTNESVPPVAEAHNRVVMNRESHECVTYQGCDPAFPVVWCEHSEGGYDGSTHGWPLFGGQQIWDFVQAL